MANDNGSNTRGHRCVGSVKEGAGEVYQQNPGDTKIQEIQKMTPSGTAHILRKVLSISYPLEPQEHGSIAP